MMSNNTNTNTNISTTLSGKEYFFKTCPSMTIVDTFLKQRVDPRPKHLQSTVLFLTTNPNMEYIDSYAQHYYAYLIWGNHNHQPHSWIIHKLWVPESLRCKGFGKTLMEWIKREADNLGIDLYLSVSSKECDTAKLIDWYRHRGFRLISPGNSGNAFPLMRRMTRRRLQGEVDRPIGKSNMGF